MFCNPITNHGAASGERHLVIMLMDTQLRYDDHARTQVITLKESNYFQVYVLYVTKLKWNLVAYSILSALLHIITKQSHSAKAYN